jgi:hypothetical protein
VDKYLDVAPLCLLDSLVGALVVKHTLTKVIFRGEVRTRAERSGESGNDFI